MRVSQTVRDLDGTMVSKGSFEHIYHLQDRLVVWMNLRELRSGNGSDHMTDTDTDIMIRRLYDGFNRRDIPAVLAMLSDDVAWANGMDGGHEHGRDAIRAYWTRQWAAIRPEVDPRQIAHRDENTVVAEVHQVVHDLDGRLLLDEEVRHVFRLKDGLMTRFDIENAGGLSSIGHS